MPPSDIFLTDQTHLSFLTHLSLASFLLEIGKTVQNQIKRRKMQRLIRFSPVYLQKCLLKFE